MSFLPENGGGALVEMALVTSLLGLPLITGTTEMAYVVYDSIEVSNAAHAAALYAMQSVTYASNPTGIQTVAQTEATDFGSALSVSSSTFWACSAAVAGTHYTGSGAQSSAQSACTGSGNHPLQFVQVNTSALVTPPFHWVKLPASFTVTGLAVMEVEQ